jgi:hypothetical protein
MLIHTGIVQLNIGVQMFLLHLLDMTGMIIGVRGGILGMIQGVTAERSAIETIMKVRSLIQEGIHVVGIMIMNMIERETDMKDQGERLADLTGTVADGNGKILHEGMVSLVLDVINLHHPQCLLAPHLMYD